MRQLSKVNFSILILCDLWELFGCIWSLWKCLYTTFLFFIFVNGNFPSSTSMNVGLRSSHLNNIHSCSSTWLCLFFFVSIFLKLIIITQSYMRMLSKSPCTQHYLCSPHMHFLNTGCTSGKHDTLHTWYFYVYHIKLGFLNFQISFLISRPWVKFSPHMHFPNTGCNSSKHDTLLDWYFKCHS